MRETIILNHKLIKRCCYRSFWEDCRLFIFPLMSDLVLADGYLFKFASSFLFTITDESVVMLYFEFVLQQYVTGYKFPLHELML